MSSFFMTNTTDKIFNYDLCNKYLIDNVDLLDASIKGYRVCLNHFSKWLKDNDIKQPTKDDIIRYKMYLKDSNYTINTKNAYLKSVRHLFKWLNANNLYPNISEDIKGFKSKGGVLKKDAFTEQDIYNQVFNTNKQDNIKLLRDEINSLNDTEINNVLDYIKSLKVKMEV